MCFLRIMKEYGKNEEGKTYGQKKNPKPPKHADREWIATKQEK